MKILLANKFYYRRGGDCIYTMNLEKMLQAHGDEVAVYAMQYPENEKSEWSGYWPTNMRSVDALTRPFGARQVVKGFTRLMDDFKPEVVHLNNIHTHLSPVIAEIAHRRGARVVWTIHDMKLLCPRYDCLRNGEPCELCFQGEKKHCLHYSCLKGSKLKSWVAYREAVAWNRRRLEQCTDLFICPSEFMAGKMKSGGFDPKKLVVLNNFIDAEKCRVASRVTDKYYCYVGRLSHEKGVRTLIAAARELPYKLVVIGTGPMSETLKQEAADHIEFVGYQPWENIKETLTHATCLVLPSEWYENNPLSVIESLCLGTPVLGARIGGIPELIEEGVSGMTFTSGDVEDLKDKIMQMFDHEFDYDAIAKNAVERYSSETYYEKLMEYYKG